ncbi:MAG: FtsB family cell division protein [Bradymonadaceae bacterium]
MRVAVILLVVTVICGAAYYVLTHPNHDQVERLDRELHGLQEQNREMARKNAELEKKIIALRDDPRLAERQARESVGLARPDELVFQFEEPEEAIRVQVRLNAKQDSLQLAGKAVSLDQLSTSLESLREEISGAKLLVVFDEDVDVLRRQTIIDIVDASPLAPAEYRKP